MGDETWANIQLLKSNRERFREKIKKRKAERETLLSSVVGGGSSTSSPSTFLPPTTSPTPLLPGNEIGLTCLFRVNLFGHSSGELSLDVFLFLLIFIHFFLSIFSHTIEWTSLVIHISPTHQSWESCWELGVL